GLGTSFGRGGATTAQQDLMNSDAILIMGSSMAENHPVGFQWVIEARERGAKIIHVDPRFSRTSAMADIWVPLRAGSDIVFLGGEAGDAGKFETDPSLEHPRCVFQVLKRHFSRYTPEMVERACGVPKDAFLKVCKTFAEASGPDKTGAICYAVGWTQHSKGPQ